MTEHRSSGRSRDLIADLLGTLRSDDYLCDLLDYDPSEDHGPESRIYLRDPPDNRRPPIAVVIDVEPTESTPNNHADDLQFSVPVDVQATKQWYDANYSAGTHFRIFDAADARLSRPGIAGLRNRQGISFTRTEPSSRPDVSHEWSAEYQYERTRVY